jgi:hypothetical protein
MQRFTFTDAVNVKCKNRNQVGQPAMHLNIVDTHRPLETRFSIGLSACLAQINRTLLIHDGYATGESAQGSFYNALDTSLH